jgi:steroid delta-isomerase
MDSASRVEQYYRAVSAGDIDAVCAMFSEDAAMRDPVGTPDLTTDQERRERYARIAPAFATFAITAHEVIASGDEAAARWTARARTHNGRDVEFTGISTFVFDADGRISAMSAYWDAAAMAKQLAD